MFKLFSIHSGMCMSAHACTHTQDFIHKSHWGQWSLTGRRSTFQSYKELPQLSQWEPTEPRGMGASQENLPWQVRGPQICSSNRMLLPHITAIFVFITFPASLKTEIYFLWYQDQKAKIEPVAQSRSQVNIIFLPENHFHSPLCSSGILTSFLPATIPIEATQT